MWVWMVVCPHMSVMLTCQGCTLLLSQCQLRSSPAPHRSSKGQVVTEDEWMTVSFFAMWLRHILRDDPGVIGCFGSLIIRHPHLAEQASWIIPLDWCFFTCIDAAVDSKLAFYLFLLHFSVITRYEAFLRSWAFFKKSSWGTVSSIIATCLDESGVKTKSGLSDILAMHCGVDLQLPVSSCFSLPLAFSLQGPATLSIVAWEIVTEPTRMLCLGLASAWSTAVCACHFLSVCTVMPAEETTVLSWRMVSGGLYICSGQRNLGRLPCW